MRTVYVIAAVLSLMLCVDVCSAALCVHSGSNIPYADYPHICDGVQGAQNYWKSKDNGDKWYVVYDQDTYTGGNAGKSDVIGFAHTTNQDSMLELICSSGQGAGPRLFNLLRTKNQALKWSSANSGAKKTYERNYGLTAQPMDAQQGSPNEKFELEGTLYYGKLSADGGSKSLSNYGGYNAQYSTNYCDIETNTDGIEFELDAGHTKTKRDELIEKVLEYCEDMGYDDEKAAAEKVFVTPTQLPACSLRGSLVAKASTSHAAKHRLQKALQPKDQ